MGKTNSNTYEFAFQNNSVVTCCDRCKGACWDKSDNFATQAAARKMFGITPNNCVNGEMGDIHCPYAS